MGYATVRFEKEGAVAKVILNRPDIRNAFNDQLLADLIDVFTKVRDDDRIRVVVLTGEGKAFCAGADLHWMRRVLEYTFEENYEDSFRLAQALHNIYTCPKPVIGRINGPAVGGGTGFVAVCDIAIAADDAFFAFSETRLGLVPAVISAYLLKCVGERNLRRYFLTSERIPATRAAELGLVNAAVPVEELDARVGAVVKMMLTGGPAALTAAKELVHRTAELSLEEHMAYSAEMIARLRMSAEGQEGMSAFLEKRTPKWVDDLE